MFRRRSGLRGDAFWIAYEAALGILIGGKVGQLRQENVQLPDPPRRGCGGLGAGDRRAGTAGEPAGREENLEQLRCLPAPACKIGQFKLNRKFRMRDSPGFNTRGLATRATSPADLIRSTEGRRP